MTALQWPGGAEPAAPEPGVAPATEPTDRVPNDPATTRWRQAARAHQARWREAHGWPVGAKKGLARTNPFIGSTIEPRFGRRSGANFLTVPALAAAVARVAEAEPNQTLDEDRLFSDLLSSMPMAFNLFGPLTASPSLAVSFASALLGSEAVADDSIVDVRFEWSPGRRNEQWTNDGTAADVALLVQAPSGYRRLVCIETKYHERSQKRGASRDDLAARRRRELSAGLFHEDRMIDAVAAGEHEQLWRDHVLALSCLTGPGAVDAVMYLLLAPSENPGWARLATEYRDLLHPSRVGTFDYMDLEEVLERWGPACWWADLFRARYLDVELPRG